MRYLIIAAAGLCGALLLAACDDVGDDGMAPPAEMQQTPQPETPPAD
jgi:hypothetical protein